MMTTTVVGSWVGDVYKCWYGERMVKIVSLGQGFLEEMGTVSAILMALGFDRVMGLAEWIISLPHRALIISTMEVLVCNNCNNT